MPNRASAYVHRYFERLRKRRRLHRLARPPPNDRTSFTRKSQQKQTKHDLNNPAKRGRITQTTNNLLLLHLDFGDIPPPWVGSSKLTCVAVVKSEWKYIYAEHLSLLLLFVFIIYIAKNTNERWIFVLTNLCYCFMNKQFFLLFFYFSCWEDFYWNCFEEKFCYDETIGK